MDLDTYATFAVALLAVVALIYLVAWVMGRIGVVHRMAGRPGKERRLQVKESLALDAKRRAVILSCDNQEHLIVLGANSELSLGSLGAQQRSTAPQEAAPNADGSSADIDRLQPRIQEGS